MRPAQTEAQALKQVQGDNRAQSCDSRQRGSVPGQNVVGKVIEILRGSKVISPRSVQAATSYVIRASAKRIDVGGYRIWDPASRKGPTYAGALAAFGGARSCRFGHDKADAVVRWPALGVTAEFSYWLITESNPAVGSQPLFAVGTSKGHVITFLFVVQAEGE